MKVNNHFKEIKQTEARDGRARHLPAYNQNMQTTEPIEKENHKLRKKSI